MSVGHLPDILVPLFMLNAHQAWMMKWGGGLPDFTVNSTEVLASLQGCRMDPALVLYAAHARVRHTHCVLALCTRADCSSSALRPAAFDVGKIRVCNICPPISLRVGFKSVCAASRCFNSNVCCSLEKNSATAMDQSVSSFGQNIFQHAFYSSAIKCMLAWEDIRFPDTL